MSVEADIRPGEVAVPLPGRGDAEVFFIGRIRTPWPDRKSCPKHGDPVAGPVCRIEVFEPWTAALAGIEANAEIDVLYWMHSARRDIVRQQPRSAGTTFGAFAIRSPVRPNPIAASRVAFLGLDRGVLLVRGLDCIDGTPLIDLKPLSCPAARSTT
ncbi:MAG: SAM-dependent methyltransferase [Methylobacteriaceae bacterium]|nr:SAM-dependent methyltransferase [Methylobacteriaceae bacterium]